MLRCLQPTVLLAPRVTHDSVQVWEAAIELGWTVRRLPSWRVPEGINDPKCDYVIYAEPLFAEAVSDQLGLILLEPPPDWLCRLPSRFTKRRISLIPLREARSLLHPTFIKPAEGKVFEPKVYQTGRELPAAEVVDDSLSVLCSEPVSFRFEARSFILNRELLSISPYWRDGALAQDGAGDWPFLDNEEAEAREFIGSVLSSDDVELPASCVLDVGFTAECGWAIIEANPCWGAGLYGCPASSALYAGQAAIRRRSAMTESDWHWTSPRVKQSP
jgi:hypothetical protein